MTAQLLTLDRFGKNDHREDTYHFMTDHDESPLYGFHIDFWPSTDPISSMTQHII